MRIFQYFRLFSQRYYAADFFAGKLDCSARGGISSILPCLFFAVCEILVLDCRLARTRDLGLGVLLASAASSAPGLAFVSPLCRILLERFLVACRYLRPRGGPAVISGSNSTKNTLTRIKLLCTGL